MMRSRHTATKAAVLKTRIKGHAIGIGKGKLS